MQSHDRAPFLSRLRYLVCITLVFLTSFIGFACKQEEKPIKLGENASEVQSPMPQNRHVRIAVGGMIIPKEGIAYYHDLLEYVQEQIGEKVDYVDREGYAEINEMLRTGQLDAAFVCSGPYVDGHREFGLELLAAPVSSGEHVYYSNIIVHKDSPVRSFEELRGKRFAFTDPLSNSGKLVPTYMLARMNETPESFFKEFIFTQSHDKAIKAVAMNLVDGAAVDSLIWDYANATNPEFTSKTRILKRSEPYAIPPFVVPGNLSPVLKSKLKRALLGAHEDSRGREILRKMRIDRFIVIDDRAYDSVREMKAWLERQKRN